MELKINLDCFNSLIKENKPSGWLPGEIVKGNGSSVGIDSRNIAKYLYGNSLTHGPALLLTDKDEIFRVEKYLEYFMILFVVCAL